ncbi:MAG: glycosyltransferase [Bacteroidales bacterium]|jgi:glycosyltransferase involved in cell wall biosynthesis|nr:glycosyltransferase [Bacteroidales bacterium]
MDIVCVSSTSWEGKLVKSTVELTKSLAQRHQMLYVDYNYTWKDVLLGVLGRAPVPVKQLLGWQRRLQKIQLPNDTNLWRLILPPVFPVNFVKNKKAYRFLQRINTAIIRRSILKATRKLHFRQPLVINAWNPFVGVFLYGKLHEFKTIYYCFDEITVGPWTKEHGGYMEEMFLKKADACVVSSAGLYQTKSALAKRCYLVENGVNYELFQTGYFFPKGEKVVIGFVGMIASRIDFELLEAIARSFPDAQLLLVGGVSFDGRAVDEEVAALKAFPNVVFAGMQAAEKVPSYLRQFHIGIIPNIKNTQTANVYPMKINEYMAAGLPVVTTDFAPLSEFEGMIGIAHSTTEFIEKIKNELATDSDEKRRNRQKQAQQNSWNNRALAFEKIIADLD